MTLNGVERCRMPFMSDARTSDSGRTMARNATPSSDGVDDGVDEYLVVQQPRVVVETDEHLVPTVHLVQAEPEGVDGRPDDERRNSTSGTASSTYQGRARQIRCRVDMWCSWTRATRGARRPRPDPDARWLRAYCCDSQ